VRDATALARALQVDRKLEVQANTLGDVPLARPNADDAATRKAADFDAVHGHDEAYLATISPGKLLSRTG
jgi:hypothetical protein